MKNLFNMTLLLLMLSPVLAFSNTSHPTTSYQDALQKYIQHQKEETKRCQQLARNKTLQAKDPGYYYFALGLCSLNFVNNEKKLNAVIELFDKSVKNNYALSYFALGLVYANKYSGGSTLYGVKGTPKDLMLAIDNYKKAASLNSAIAQNNLGEIYLDYANFNQKNRKTEIQGKDVKNDDAPILLPDIDKAIYWLTMAAKNGNPAAQGTLSDLYKQGIGVPQDYVKAYVWQNLCAASQLRFNRMMQTYGGEKVSKIDKNIRDDFYSKLTIEQKNEAQHLLTEYSKKYFIKPSSFDKACQYVQTTISLNNLMKIIMPVIANFSAHEKSH